MPKTTPTKIKSQQEPASAQSTSPINIQEVPGPKGLPWIGNIDCMAKHMLNTRHKPGSRYAQAFIEMCEELVEKYGDFTRFRAFNTVYPTNDPNVIKHIIDNPDTFQKIFPNKSYLFNIRKNLGESALFTAYDTEEIWYVARRIINPAMSKLSTYEFLEKMIYISEYHLDYIENNKNILLSEFITKLTLSVIEFVGFNSHKNYLKSKTLLPPLSQVAMEIAKDAAACTARILPEWIYKKQEKIDKRSINF